MDFNKIFNSACEEGHHELAKHLLTYEQVDPSTGNNVAIRFSSQSGHLEVVKLLLSRPEVDPSAMDNWAIRNASSSGQIAFISPF